MIPDELKQLNNWCVWVYQERDGKVTKVPVDPVSGELAKSNDPSTWCDYDTAVNVWQNTNANGLGFFFTPPYVGIDIDDVADEVERYKLGDYDTNIVFEFYESFKSYGELSPSGTGFHIITKGKIPGARRRHKNVEMYDSGRFFTMTGNSLGKYSEVSEVSELNFDRIYRKYLPDNVQKLSFENHGISHSLSDSAVIAKALESKSGEKFRLFLNGGWETQFSSQSEADMAFANILAFWCARDFAQMDSIFRRSSLMREKWDEKRGKTTYGEATLYKAINETADVYTPTNQREPMKYDLSFLDNKTEDDVLELPPRSWDDTGNAQRFMDNYGGIVKYSYQSSKFYVYDGQKWQIDNMGLVNRLIDSTIENMKFEKITVPEEEEEAEEIVQKFQGFISKSRSTNSKKNIYTELKHLTAISTDEFDKDNMTINVQNGYIDLSSGELHEHDQDKMFSKITNVEYSNKMRPDAWLDFLNDIFDGDEDLIRYIQKALGYSLTGSAEEQIMFILLGNGRNGKSLFVNTIAEMLGDYSKNTQAETLMEKKGDKINNDVARLNDTRFVTSTEPNQGFVFDEGLVKQMTGDDKVSARFLHQEFFEFDVKFKIWLATNHRPIVKGTDDGIWRRLITIPFDVQIPVHKVDKKLKFKLMREAPAILEWMVEGCLLWQKEGLENLPRKIKEANADYRFEMDPVQSFIEEQCIIGDDFEENGSTLYEAYTKWCVDNDRYDVGKNNFGKQLKSKFKSKKSGVIKYLGLKILRQYTFGSDIPIK